MPRLSVRLACLAISLLLAAPAWAQAPRLHRFAVSIDTELTVISVRACFAGPPPEALVAESLDAPLALIEARVEGSGKPLVPSGALSLKSVPDGGCVLYRVDVSRPIKRHDRTGGKVARVGRDLLTSVGLWLWRPQQLSSDEDVEIRFVLPEGIAVSAPWRAVSAPQPPAFVLDRAPFDWPASVAFGRFREREIAVGDAQLRLAVLDGHPQVDTDSMQAWLTDAARMVAGVYGCFPVPRLQLLVVPNARGNEPVPGAYVARGGGPSVHFFINQRHPIEEFFADWTATHELAHLLLPLVEDRDAWLSEGLATYYQNVLRARAGRISEQEAWSMLHAGFVRGRNNAADLTLAQATQAMYRGNTHLRVYWGGAALILLADVGLRQQTGGRQSMDRALEALHACCLEAGKIWSAAELLAKLDELTGTSIFSALYSAHVASREFPDLSAVYRQLGLRANGSSVQLLDDGPQRQLRASIMRREAPGEIAAEQVSCRHGG